MHPDSSGEPLADTENRREKNAMVGNKEMGIACQNERERRQDECWRKREGALNPWLVGSGPCGSGGRRSLHTHTHTHSHFPRNTHTVEARAYTQIIFTHTRHLNADTFLWFQFLRGTSGPEKTSHPKTLSHFSVSLSERQRNI